MNRIDHDAVSPGVARSCWQNNAIRLVEKTLVVRRVMLFVESGGETKVGQFDVAILVNKNIIWFYITMRRLACIHLVLNVKTHRWIKPIL